MRLIDADELINQGYEIVVDSWQYDTCNKSIDIDTIPTAYSVDKVVDELEDWTFNADINIGDGTIMNHNLIESRNAIEIVKKGGVYDDVCEWHCDEYGRWHTECHILADNDPLEYTYCPYCGKKIKVV